MSVDRRINLIYDNGWQRRQQMRELFILDNWRVSDSYQRIKQYTKHDNSVLEIGCLTGHHLLLLAEEGYNNLTGIEFSEPAIKWAIKQDKDSKIEWINDYYPNNRLSRQFDCIVLFDVVEHVFDLKTFFEAVISNCNQNTKVLILVPKGEEFMDEGHVNFYPSVRALNNLLKIYFNVEIMEDTGNKLFALCKRIYD